MKKLSFLSLVCGALLVCATATPASAESWNENGLAERTENDRKGVRDAESKAINPKRSVPERTVPEFAKDRHESESAGNTGNSRSGEVRRGEIKATTPAGMSERAVPEFAKNWRGNIPVDREEDDNGETRSDETDATEPAGASGRVDQDWGGRRNQRGYGDWGNVRKR